MVNRMKEKIMDLLKTYILSNKSEDKNIWLFSKSDQIIIKSAYKVLSTRNILNSMNSIS